MNHPDFSGGSVASTPKVTRPWNPPRPDNKQDWYLLRPLKYHKHRIRDTAPGDIRGAQMAP